MKQVRFILFLVLTFFSAQLCAQIDPSSIARVEEGKVIYLLDLDWSDVQKKQVILLFDLDSTLWQKLSSGAPEIMLDSAMWHVRKLTRTKVELSKPLERKPAAHLNKFDILLGADNLKTPPGYVDQEKVIYGFNSFSRNNVYRYNKGIVQFFLPGNTRAKKVFIAGSFNEWAPQKTAMQKVDSGWIVKIALKPGKYYYKYILDGHWITDPNNRFEENDGMGNINSVLYLPNFQFKLENYKDAKKVVVAGTFNNWNRAELRMRRTADGWTLPLYLKDGTYSYKFLVDDQWITDPGNETTRKDLQGNQNSVIAKGDEHIFHLKGFEQARQVILAGNFNNWKTNDLPMNRVAGGWELPYRFAPGNYEYKFIVDGRWMPDPANPYTIGESDLTNSVLAYKANYTFKLSGFSNARRVIVTGSFLDWNPEGYKMIKKDGVWTFPVYLNKGKHLYKFIVDGKWILDPGNKLWEQNEFGTGNSVLWVE